jgi:hypothetical protein
MDPIIPFLHLKIQACWPESELDEDFSHYFSQVIIPRRTCPEAPGYRLLQEYYETRPLSDQKHMVRAEHNIYLQMCLLRMPLFQDCKKDDLRDMRWNQPPACECQNRPLLIEALAEALTTYERELNESGWHVIHQLPGVLETSIPWLQLTTDIYTELYVRGKLPNAPMRPQKLAQALGVWKRISKTLTLEDYERGVTLTKNVQKTKLVTHMRQAFDSYGPAPRKYPLGALDYSIALILQQCGIETGEPGRIAKRLSKRLVRAQKPPRSQ